MTEKIVWDDEDRADGLRRSSGRGLPQLAGLQRLPVVLVAAGGLLAAAIVGGGVTYLTTRSSNGPATASAPPVIRADEKPIKVYPDAPGGMEVPNRDKLVYSRLKGEGDKGDVERLLPEPEQPIRPAAPGAAPSSASASPPSPAAGAMPEDEDLPAEQATIPPAPPPAAPPAARAPAAQPAKPAQVASAKPLPAEPASKAAKPAVTRPQPAAGGFQVQLLAARSQDDAMAAWKKLQSKNSDVLAGMNGMVARADLGDRGVFYRLRVGPIANEQQAKSLCSTLSGRKVSCLIVRPGR
jgi:cell division septation protein DedD